MSVGWDAVFSSAACDTGAAAGGAELSGEAAHGKQLCAGTPCTAALAALNVTRLSAVHDAQRHPRASSASQPAPSPPLPFPRTAADKKLDYGFLNRYLVRQQA